MKCHAGVEFPDGNPCPKCNAELGEVCWPGINADLLELARLRKGIQDYLDGNYGPELPTKHDQCPHGRYGWEDCECCVDVHFTALLSSQERHTP